MGRQDIDVTVTTCADPATVYALLRDGASWPSWSPIGSFELERPAADEPEGWARCASSAPPSRWASPVSREQIVELVPDRRLSYVLISGLPIRDYRADVDLTPDRDGGTAIRWHSTFRGAMPGAARSTGSAGQVRAAGGCRAAASGIRGWPGGLAGLGPPSGGFHTSSAGHRRAQSTVTKP